MKFIFDELQVKAGTAHKTAELLTMHTQEVEHVHESGVVAHGVITGKIIDIQQHPNADRLRIATIDLGKDVLDIVTGAPNIEMNQIVPVALPGAVVIAVDHHEQHSIVDHSKTMTIKPTTLRGIESAGMLCGADELGLSSIAAMGVYVFSEDTPLGMAVEELLPNTAIIETDDKGTAHRPDLLSYSGIEQELSAILKVPFTRKSIGFPDQKTSDDLVLSIEAPEGCSVFMVAKIDGMTTDQSPEHIQHFLKKSDVKVINLVTDVTNFLMLKEGASTHAFDSGAVEGKRIMVRWAKPDEHISTLNHQSYKLTNRDLVIADASKPLDIAGIIGGSESSVRDNSSSIILTAAVFTPKNIRATSKRFGIRTDASARFERGQSPAAAKQVFAQAVKMICELSGGSVSVLDIIGESEEKTTNLTIRVADVNAFLGTTLDHGEITDILQRLGYNVSGSGQDIHLTIPWWRVDVSTVADVYEDIARIHGYNNISLSIPHLPNRTVSKQEKTITVLRHVASSYLYEVETSSMVERGNGASTEIQNPVGGRKFIRQTMVPQLFELTKRMVRSGYEQYGCFEIGKTYRNSDGRIDEKIRFGMCVASSVEEAKQTLGLLLHHLHIAPSDIYFEPCPQSEDRMIKYDAVAKIFLRDQLIGHMCVELSRGKSLCAFKLYVNELANHANFEPHFKPYSLYPSVKRDVTFVIDRDINVSEISKNIYNSAREDLDVESIPTVKTYDGPEIPSDKKSISMTIVFRSSLRTLTDAQVNDIMKQIEQMLTKDFKATIR